MNFRKFQLQISKRKTSQNRFNRLNEINRLGSSGGNGLFVRCFLLRFCRLRWLETLPDRLKSFDIHKAGGNRQRTGRIDGIEIKNRILVFRNIQLKFPDVTRQSVHSKILCFFYVILILC